MHLILLAAAAWSVGLGLRRCLALRTAGDTDKSADTLGEWTSALSLVVAGIWAWQTNSWLALGAGYFLGWIAQWLLPASAAPSESHRAA